MRSHRTVIDWSNRIIGYTRKKPAAIVKTAIRVNSRQLNYYSFFSRLTVRKGEPHVRRLMYPINDEVPG